MQNWDQTWDLSCSLSGACMYPWSHGHGGLLRTSFTAPPDERYMAPFFFGPYKHFEWAIHVLNNQKVRIVSWLRDVVFFNPERF